MKPYSQDLSERIIAALETGTDSQSEIATTFGVSLSFVEKLWRGWRKIGDCAALPLEHLKFIDESGVNLALTRSHGRAAPGENILCGQRIFATDP
jgi:hypothetical protein